MRSARGSCGSASGASTRRISLMTSRERWTRALASVHPRRRQPARSLEPGVLRAMHSFATRDVRMTTVAITQNREDIGRAIDEALRQIALEDVVRGRLVAVKPNETWATAEDTSAVTQADTLRAVLRAVKRYGPREVVVTGGAGAAE